MAHISQLLGSPREWGSPLTPTGMRESLIIFSALTQEEKCLTQLEKVAVDDTRERLLQHLSSELKTTSQRCTNMASTAGAEAGELHPRVPGLPSGRGRVSLACSACDMPVQTPPNVYRSFKAQGHAFTGAE